jgi:two-component system response regulator YesN
LEFEHFSVQAFPLLRQSKELGAGETPALRSNHSQQIVQRMLDYIHEHYSRPMQLGDVAAAMNMNAAYVSSLFHTTTGVTFHHYLEELRLARAKDLLRDPVNQVCEVACAVGYTNPNHFRDVFKTRVRIPPSVWRDRPEP